MQTLGLQLFYFTQSTFHTLHSSFWVTYVGFFIFHAFSTQTQTKAYTVLAVSNCVGHDVTSYAVLQRVEGGFWCGTCRCEIGTHCWVHRLNVKAAHFGATMLKRKTTGEGDILKGLEIWPFPGVNADEIAWNFPGGVLPTRHTLSRGNHSPGPPELWASTQKPHDVPYGQDCICFVSCQVHTPNTKNSSALACHSSVSHIIRIEAWEMT